MEHSGGKTVQTFVVHSPHIAFNSQADTNGPNTRIVSQLRNAHPTFESNELIDSKAIRVCALNNGMVKIIEDLRQMYSDGSTASCSSFSSLSPYPISVSISRSLKDVQYD